jgi:hypothetical protein
MGEGEYVKPEDCSKKCKTSMDSTLYRSDKFYSFILHKRIRYETISLSDIDHVGRRAWDGTTKLGFHQGNVPPRETEYLYAAGCRR